MNLSACGLLCNECPSFGKECQGCFAVGGKPFWAGEFTTTGICPLFDCSVNHKALRNCGGCNELPCQLFLSMKDPNATEEEHQESLKLRIKRLRN